jgi:signal peptidase I
MENTLHRGDYVLVNRIGARHPGHNRIVVFTSPLIKDRKDSPIMVSRCVAMPGDTIQVTGDGYRINKTLYPLSPDALSTYTVQPAAGKRFTGALKRLGIAERDLRETSSGITLRLTSFEEYSIREELPPAVNKGFIKEGAPSYIVVVPRRGEPYRLTASALTACREAIRAEAAGEVEFRDHRLFVDGKEMGAFTFREDYYWLLSDNINEAVDSRHLGFIPSRSIIGAVWLCWYSVDGRRTFKTFD